MLGDGYCRIAVSCRMRPALDAPQLARWDLTPNTISVQMRKEERNRRKQSALAFNKQESIMETTMEHVFDDATSTEEVYNAAFRSIVQQSLKGLNGCIMAYGQTSSGKTFSMLGNLSSSRLGGAFAGTSTMTSTLTGEADPYAGTMTNFSDAEGELNIQKGIIELAIEDIFRSIAAEEEKLEYEDAKERERMEYGECGGSSSSREEAAQAAKTFQADAENERTAFARDLKTQQNRNGYPLSLTMGELSSRKKKRIRKQRVRFSLCEIYMEKVTDLLSNDRISLSVKECQSSHTGQSGPEFYVEGLSEHDAACSADILDRIAKAEKKRRKVAATKYNEQSSRSHTVLTVTIEYSEPVAGEEVSSSIAQVGRLVFVDLAGNERLDEGMLYLQEGSSINLSLFFLGECISKLSQRADESMYGTTTMAPRMAGKQHQASGTSLPSGADGYSNSPHDYYSTTMRTHSKDSHGSKDNTYIPYRDSKLTRILAVHLGQNSHTGILVCLHPGEEFVEQSMCSLRFAQKASQVVAKIRPVFRSKQEEDIARLRNRVLQLQQQVHDEQQRNQMQQQEAFERGREAGQEETSSMPGTIENQSVQNESAIASSASGNKNAVVSNSKELDAIVQILHKANSNYKALHQRYRGFVQSVQDKIKTKERRSSVSSSERSATLENVGSFLSSNSTAATGETGAKRKSDLVLLQEVGQDLDTFLQEYQQLIERSEGLQQTLEETQANAGVPKKVVQNQYLADEHARMKQENMEVKQDNLNHQYRIRELEDKLRKKERLLHNAERERLEADQAALDTQNNDGVVRGLMEKVTKLETELREKQEMLTKLVDTSRNSSPSKSSHVSSQSQVPVSGKAEKELRTENVNLKSVNKYLHEERSRYKEQAESLKREMSFLKQDYGMKLHSDQMEFDQSEGKKAWNEERRKQYEKIEELQGEISCKESELAELGRMLDESERKNDRISEEKLDLLRRLEASKYNVSSSSTAEGGSSSSSSTGGFVGGVDQEQQQQVTELNSQLQSLKEEYDGTRGELGKFMSRNRDLDKRVKELTFENLALKRDLEIMEDEKEENRNGPKVEELKEENPKEPIAKQPTAGDTAINAAFQQQLERIELRYEELQKTSKEEKEVLLLEMEKLQASQRNHETFVISMQNRVDERERALRSKEREVNDARAEAEKKQKELIEEITQLRREKKVMDASLEKMSALSSAITTHQNTMVGFGNSERNFGNSEQKSSYSPRVASAIQKGKFQFELSPQAPKSPPRGASSMRTRNLAQGSPVAQLSPTSPGNTERSNRGQELPPSSQKKPPVEDPYAASIAKTIESINARNDFQLPNVLSGTPNGMMAGMSSGSNVKTSYISSSGYMPGGGSGMKATASLYSDGKVSAKDYYAKDYSAGKVSSKDSSNANSGITFDSQKDDSATLASFLNPTRQKADPVEAANARIDQKPFYNAKNSRSPPKLFPGSLDNMKPNVRSGGSK